MMPGYVNTDVGPAADRARVEHFFADQQQAQHEQFVRTAETVGLMVMVNQLIGAWQQRRQARKEA